MLIARNSHFSILAWRIPMDRGDSLWSHTQLSDLSIACSTPVWNHHSEEFGSGLSLFLCKKR